MKVIDPARAQKRKLTREPQSFSLSTAKTYLGRLLQRAIKGEPVYIVRGPHRFALQYVPEIEPVPMRPPGYFGQCDTRAEIELENRLSKASVIQAPEDLE